MIRRVSASTNRNRTRRNQGKEEKMPPSGGRRPLSAGGTGRPLSGVADGEGDCSGTDPDSVSGGRENPGGQRGCLLPISRIKLVQSLEPQTESGKGGNMNFTAESLVGSTVEKRSGTLSP